jgi:sugar phosphate isomerase/epimerase
MKRRIFITAVPTMIATFSAIDAARQALAAIGVNSGRLGICSFSCHRAWQAARDKSAPAPFVDAPTFYDYARSLGADGVQTSVATLDETASVRLGEHVEQTGGYYEGDIRLPSKESELDRFEQEVRLTRAAGGNVARTCLSGTRRYETWRTMEEFNAFHTAASQRLAWVEPILKKHRLRLAVENHKDLTSDELATLMRKFSSEWIGVNVDTGNNLALLEDPHEAVETLAPFAMSVHFKDMAVQPYELGFKLSEVRCGQGFLDLPRMLAALSKSNSQIHFNLEMATRDPLLIPCLADGYFVTFPGRKSTHLDAAMQRVKDNSPKQPPPSIAGKPMAQQLAEEEANNRSSLAWMHHKFS